MGIKDIIYESNKSKDSLFFDNIYEYIQSRKDYIYKCTKQGDILADEDDFKPHYYIRWDDVKTKEFKRFKSKPLYFNPSPSDFDEMLASLATTTAGIHYGTEDIITTNES